MDPLSHLDAEGRARMVDVGGKKPERRLARASGAIRLAAATVELIRGGRVAKGNVLTVAQIAGIQAAKRTGELIPLCHPLSLDHVAVTLELGDAGVTATSEVSCTVRHGRGDGSPHGRERGAAHRLRHVQGGRSADDDRADRPAGKGQA